MLRSNGERPGRDAEGVLPRLVLAAKATPEEALQMMETGREGLSSREAARRHDRFGRNEVARERPPSWWVQLAGAFYNPFIIILVVLGGVSLVTDVVLPHRERRAWEASGGAHSDKAVPPSADWTKIVILGVMISVSGLLRFWQEYRSAKAAESLKALVRTTTTLLRDGSEREVALAELVPGDIVHLAAGDMVPADLRLLAAKDLFISQSALTGEAMPVEKSELSASCAQGGADGAASLLGACTLCFMGTNVLSGTASGVVVATGRETLFGSLARSVMGKRPMTSFDIGVNKVSFLLVKFMLVMVPIVMLINGVTKGDWKEAFLFGLAVAVGLTPEMLPLVVTANLAKGAVAMSREKVIVKRLNAIQNFGAMNVLCTDKTGTLTEDKVALLQYLDRYGRRSHLVLLYAFLNSHFQTGLRNLLDRAVAAKAAEVLQAGVEANYQKVDEIPFDFTRRRMSVVLRHRGPGRHLFLCKGGVEEVLAVCSRMHDREREAPLTEEDRRQMRRLCDELNEDGLRVLAVASKVLSDPGRPFTVEDERDLTFLGFITFLDPPKASAKRAIASLAGHGVQVKVITGDNPVVAAKVCREVGLEPGIVIVGPEIDALPDAELAPKVQAGTLFARMNPIQKARIIRLLKASGCTVGYMGDGINDAAALRDADVGISVDSAVDIAKESADIILLEKSLMVLERGIIEGRTVFGNIIKYIKMTASSNFGNVLSVLVASALLPFLPMLPLQLLVQNLLYDFSQLSLPWDRMDAEFLQAPRRWEESGLARFMLCIGPLSSVFDMVTFWALWTVFQANTVAHQSLFQSGWFVEGLLSQTLVVHLIRTQKIPFLQSWAAPPVLLLTGGVMALGLLLPGSSFGHHIGLQPLPGSFYPWLMGILFAYCALTQAVKVWFIRRFGGWI